MFNGFIKVAAATPNVKVANCSYNAQRIIEIIQKAHAEGVKVLVLPELSITAYTCSDLFFQDRLLSSALHALSKIKDATKGMDILTVAGIPIRHGGKIYNCAAVIHNGRILGFVPKTYIPNHNEFYERRHFAGAMPRNTVYSFEGKDYPFGTKIIFSNRSVPEVRLAVEICEDLWAPATKSTEHSLAGANLICNPSASDELIGKGAYRVDLVKSQSARSLCAYVFCDAGEGESSTDMVFAAHHIIAEGGNILAENKLFSYSMLISEVDISRLESERSRNTSFITNEAQDYTFVDFSFEPETTTLTRTFSKHPFIPSDGANRSYVCEDILSIQSAGLKKRVRHTNPKKIVLGISGGLDSSLALIVAGRTMKALGRPTSDILALTMPSFGTTGRTYENAVRLVKKIGATMEEVNIEDAVLEHFRQIGQSPDDTDITYENSQARIRTLILMDKANKEGGFVLGTGDLSELALGWATYGGDHLSMYNVNSSVPKTLIKHLIQYEADNAADDELSRVLNDILGTPISPELLPSSGEKISQKTEDLIGPYELHDFFLYYVVRCCFAPGKIYRLAKLSFGEDYSDDTILKWLKVFYKRFFSQQFKRSCMPDGPKVGSVCLSPRGDWRMPSDAVCDEWLEELESL